MEQFGEDRLLQLHDIGTLMPPARDVLHAKLMPAIPSLGGKETL